MMSDMATLSHCSIYFPIWPPSVCAHNGVSISALSSVSAGFFNKKDDGGGQKDGRQGGKTILQCQLFCSLPAITAATSGASFYGGRMFIFCHCEPADSDWWP